MNMIQLLLLRIINMLGGNKEVSTKIEINKDDKEIQEIKNGKPITLWIPIIILFIIFFVILVVVIVYV